MATVGRLNILIEADAQQLERSLKSAQRRMEAFGNDLKRVGRSLTTGVTVPLALVATASLKMAASAQESENLFEVSMEGMADSARTFSEQIAKSLGLNAFAVRDTIGRFNVLFTTLGIGERAAADMAQELTELSADLSSFFEISQPEVFDALQSGLVGMIRPLRRFNVFLNESRLQAFAYANGIAEAGRELDEAQKVQARYGLIVQDTSKAQGDLIRTFNSTANTMRRIRERTRELLVEIGNSLTPTFDKLLTVVEDGISTLRGAVVAFDRLSPAMQNVAIASAVIAAAFGPLLLLFGGFSASIGAIIGLVARFSFALVPMVGLLAANAPLVLGIVAATVALGALFANMTKTERATRRARRELEEFRDSLGQPVTVDFVSGIRQDAVFAAIKVAELQQAVDDLEASDEDPLKLETLKTQLKGAESDLDVFVAKAEKIKELDIETKATVIADIAQATNQLRTFQEEIRQIEDREIVFDDLISVKSGEIIRSSADRAANAIRVLQNQADSAVTEILTLEGRLAQLAETGAVAIVPDPAALEKLRSIGAVITELDNAIDALNQKGQVIGLTGLELAEEELAATLGAIDDLIELGVKPGQGELATLQTRFEELTSAIAIFRREADLVGTIDAGALQGVLAPSGGTLAQQALAGQDFSGQKMADEMKKQLELATSVIQSFEGAFRNAGRGLVLAMTDGAISIGNIFKSAILGIVGGAVGAIFGQIGGRLAGSLFPGLFSATGPTAGASAVAGASAIAPTIVVDMSGAVLFGDPAGEARKPGAQVFIREGNEAAREGGA